MMHVALRIALIAVLTGVSPAPAQQTTAPLVVDRADDVALTGPTCTSAPDDCSFRAALARANATPNTTISIGVSGPLTRNASLPDWIISGQGTTVDGGMARTRLDTGNVVQGLIITGQRITIRNLHVQPDTRTGIRITGAAMAVTLEHMLIGIPESTRAIATTGIHIDATATPANESSRVRIRESHIAATETGILIETDSVSVGESGSTIRFTNNLNAVTISGSNARNNQVRGATIADTNDVWDTPRIIVRDGAANTIIGPDNTFNHIRARAIHVYGSGTRNNTIIGNTITNKYIGIAVSQGATNTIIGSASAGNNITAGTGIYLTDTAATEIAYNTITSGDGGIVANGVISDNYHHNSINSGTSLKPFSYPNAITSQSNQPNQFYGHREKHGIVFADQSAYSDASENSVTGFYHAIAVLESSTITITANELSHSLNGITTGHAENVSIRNNRISQNGIGIVLAGDWSGESHDNNIVDNIIANNRYGVILTDRSTNNLIRANTILSNTNGILLDNYAGGDTFEQNTIMSNTIGLAHDGNGVQMVPTTLTGDRFISNTHAISASYGVVWNDLYLLENTTAISAPTWNTPTITEMHATTLQNGQVSLTVRGTTRLPGHVEICLTVPDSVPAALLDCGFSQRTASVSAQNGLWEANEIIPAVYALTSQVCVQAIGTFSETLMGSSAPTATRCTSITTPPNATPIPGTPASYTLTLPLIRR